MILQRKDSGTRNHFLGGTSGPYIWGKEKHTPGISGSQGNLERRDAVTPAREKIRERARLQPCRQGIDSIHAPQGTKAPTHMSKSGANRTAPVIIQGCSKLVLDAAREAL